MRAGEDDLPRLVVDGHAHQLLPALPRGHRQLDPGAR